MITSVECPWRQDLRVGPGKRAARSTSNDTANWLVCVRYLYDRGKSCRHKTIELIVETVPWQPKARQPRRHDEEIISVRIAWTESDLRERAKRLGAGISRDLPIDRCIYL